MYKSEWVKASENLLLKKSLEESQMERWQLLKINELQKYYRKAIVNNTFDLKSMQDAIQVSLYDCSSTVQRPDHIRRPKSSSLWCCFNKGEWIRLKIEYRH